ncbi:hypothetical protein AVEN_158785-1, partial [Araneus ventricosus]
MPEAEVACTTPPTLQNLRQCITHACASVTPNMLKNVQREIQTWVQMCIVDDGEQFEHRKY